MTAATPSIPISNTPLQGQNTMTQIETIEGKLLNAPSGGVAGNAFTYSDTIRAIFKCPVPAHLCTGNEPETVEVEAPAGSTYLYNARRMCGDWYAEFAVGKVSRSGVGATQADALRAAAEMFTS